MISLKKRNQGFTIVELLIVIVVIGILAMLVITTYGGIQAKARNSQRQSDIQSLATQIEAYYSQNQHYPSWANINDEDWRSGDGEGEGNMKSLDLQALIDPSNADQADTSPIANAPAAKVYSYEVSDADGDPCEADSTTCAQYVLTATFEGEVNGSNTYTKRNLD